MDPRYNGWTPQQGYYGQYVPPPAPPNGYPPIAYPMQYPPQQMQHMQQMPPMQSMMSQPQPMPAQPRVVIPPRQPQQQYAPPPMHPDMAAQQRAMQPMQPQFLVPRGNPGVNMNSSPLANMAPPRIRQVQVPVQRQPQAQRPNGDRSHGTSSPHMQAPGAKPVQRSVSSQENSPRPQQQVQRQPSVNQSQHRAPLQPQTTPQQKTPSSSAQTPSAQHRSPSLPQTPSSQNRAHPQVVIKKPSSAQSRTPQTPTKALPADLTVLLLSAADEYIAAARQMGSTAALMQKEADLEQYYKLMSTGLGCMEAVLKRYNQAPRDEANLRLRYATLLVEETDNHVEIEDVISKGIALCQRSRLLDLKYSMQHLHARYQFQSNHRAALKSLDGPISEAETFQHIVWVYAFRFLKVTLAMQVSGRPETASALQQLHAITNHADKRGDRAIFVTASALEAMIYLRTPGPEHLENAQRAIAAARSYQLEASSKQLGQIAVVIDSIDLACSIQQGKCDTQKMTALQQKADREPGPESGIFSVLIEKSFGGNLTFFTGGVFKKSGDGRDELVFSWLPQNDLRTLAYYLSGLTTASREPSRGINYLHEGFKITQYTMQHHSSLATSLTTSVKQRNWVAVLDWHLRFALGLMAIRAADDIPSARKALASLRGRLNSAPFESNEEFARLAAYLGGVLEQSAGSLDLAARTYSSQNLVLSEKSPNGAFKTDLAILATMNRILILRNPRHPEHHLVSILFGQLETLCISHPNVNIASAFRVIRAFTNTDTSINRQKTLASNALTTSQKYGNHQLVAFCLCYMSSRFFSETVGEQAIKSVRAARTVAKNAKSALWRAVALGLCVNAFQKNGMLQDAAQCQQDLNDVVGRLPPALVESLKCQVAGGGDSGVYPGGDAYRNVQMTG